MLSDQIVDNEKVSIAQTDNESVDMLLRNSYDRLRGHAGEHSAYKQINAYISERMRCEIVNHGERCINESIALDAFGRSVCNQHNK